MFAATLDTSLSARTPAPRWWQRAAPWAVLLGSLVGAGCGGLPQHVERQPSWSLPVAEDTPLARLAQASTLPQQPQLSGFRLLADGADALATRLALIDAARSSLDLQYFLISDDASGAQLLFQFCAALQERVSILVTTNLPFSAWVQVLGDERLTSGLLDRLTFRCHILEFLGDSFRFRHGLERQASAGAADELLTPAVG